MTKNTGPMQGNNKTPLGKGLAALLGELNYAEEGPKPYSEKEKFFDLDILKIQPGKMQPRQYFNPEHMVQLIESIKDRGVLQPIVVRKMSDDKFEIIAGERRWRAAKEAGLKHVPVATIFCTDEEALAIGLIENLQRDDLNAMEEAESLQKLMVNFRKTQEEIAATIRKSRSYVANLIRLNSLPDYVKELIRTGKLSAGHARTLLGAENIDDLVKQILSEKLSVRQTEDLVREQNTNSRKKAASGTRVQKNIDPDLVLVSKTIEDVLGLPTKIDITRNGGFIKLSFETYEQLDTVVSKIQAIK
ncbi:MAG: ParB/RepB/Spo0J family partition protein [Proteobacteria bacterium]|nr:ParB/RepB/Spo0J family partition protein [Pseudomonadota bacterium]